MKNHYLLCVAIIIGFSSCNFGTSEKKVKPDIFKDTLTYTIQKVYERASDCGNKADSACTVVKIQYPVFKDRQALNDTIKHRLTTLFNNEKKADTSLTVLAKAFISAYTEFKKSDPKSVMFYTMDAYVRVVNQDTSLAGLQYGGYTFQGGAHGSSFTGFVNWEPRTNKKIVLDDIFVPGYQDKLTKIAETIFRKDEKLTDTSSLARDYFFKNNKFALNNNYLITPLGLRFLYNQYEIKPYAAGQTELLIPYDKIRTLIRPNAVVKQYINKDAGI